LDLIVARSFLSSPCFLFRVTQTMEVKLKMAI